MQVRFTLHNISFGESFSCTTESDIHTGRPKCTLVDNENDSRIGELNIYDLPYDGVRLPLGCYCDNTTSSFQTSPTFLSSGNIMELTFTVTKLNITDDFTNIYFYGTYEMEHVSKCRKQMRLLGNGGEDSISYPYDSYSAQCAGHSWYVQAQGHDRSLFIATWGSLISTDTEDTLKCNTRNRLILYSGQPMKPIKIICPSSPGSRPAALHMFSEDWINPSAHVFDAKYVLCVVLCKPFPTPIKSLSFILNGWVS